MKNILFLLAFVSSLAFGQSYPSPTYNVLTLQTPLALTSGGVGANNAAGARTNLGLGTIATLNSPLPVANGGTNATSAGGTALDNITGFASTGFLTRTGAGTYAFQSLTNGITYGNLAQAAANTVLGNSTGSTANVAAITVTGCNGAAQALQWTNGSGFGCNSGIATSGANANITSLIGLTSVPAVGGATLFPTAATNAALQAISTASFSAVTRLGYNAAGDVPALTYTASGSACSLNSGNGDNGFQVKSSDSKCWIANAQASYDIREWGITTADSGTNNATAMTNIFADTGSHTFLIPQGTYKLACGTYYTAASSISLIGQGPGVSTLQMASACAVTQAQFAWSAKSNVKVSNFTLDLNNSTYAALQNVLQFQAYTASANNLSVDHMAIINGNSPSLVVGIASAGGFSYTNVVADHNYIQITPATSQNQCIALSTNNSLGFLPNAQITNNQCNGSGLQADGVNTIVTDNDITNFQFGNAIFTNFNTGLAVTGASWASNVATVNFASTPNAFVVGESINVYGMNPSGYNVTSVAVTAVTNTSVSYALASNPGAFVSGGTVVPFPSNNGCLIANNNMHDTGQTKDVNNTPPNGVENNCINSVVVGNKAIRLGGSGYYNFATNSRYMANSSVNSGSTLSGTAGGNADKAAFVIFNNGTGNFWYQSNNVTMVGNTAFDDGANFTQYGYYEEPSNTFNTVLRGNDFRGKTQNQLIQLSGLTSAGDSFLSSATQSNVATIQFTGLDTASYKRWRLTCHDLFPTSAAIIGIQVGEGAGPTWETTANYAVIQSENSGGTVTSTSSTISQINIGLNAYNTSIVPSNFVADFGDLSQLVQKLVSFKGAYRANTSGNFTSVTGVGGWTADTGAITALRVLAASGNITGTCTLEGFPQ